MRRALRSALGTAAWRGAALGAAALAAVCVSSVALAQTILPDGSTATSVAAQPDASLEITIAPATAAGVSLNRYERFSVGAAGAALDNRAAAAEAIVNEVTGAAPSTIAGPLSVLGAEADVVLANPNGITVSGGEFLNMRELTLATGMIEESAEGGLDLVVRGGAVSIGADGLSAAVERARLLSRSLRIEGPVSLQDGALETRQGDLRLPLGARGVGAPPAPLGAAGAAVDVTSSAFLAAGSIRMIATGEGAGVRVAGGMASAGDITFSSTGALSLDGVEASAEGRIEAVGASVSLESAALTAETGDVFVEATAGALTASDAALSGRLRSFDSFRSAGAVTLISSSDMSVEGGILGGSEDDIALFSGASLAVIGASVETLADVRMSASGDLSLGAIDAEVGGAARALSVGGAAITDSRIASREELSVDAAAITVLSEARRSELVASEGGVILISRSGAIANQGGLIEGASRVEGAPASLGAVTLTSAGGVTNESLDADRLGVIFGREGDLVLRAAGDIRNETARLISNFDVDIETDGAFENVTAMDGGGEATIRRYERGSRRWWTLFTKRERVTEYVAAFGDPVAPGERALTTSAAGAVHIDAATITNSGGDLSGVDVVLRSAGDLSNEAALTGALRYVERCIWFCESDGSGAVSSTGGVIIASQDLSIEAGGAMRLRGGEMSGGGAVEIAAASVFAEVLPIPQILERPGGLRGWLSGGGDVVWLVESAAPSRIASLGGDLTLSGAGVLRGVELLADGALVIDPEAEIVAAPDPAAYGPQPGGLFADFLLETTP
ncbi:MAG: filamentous hemagglutinin N-terminal domain-containing protein [Pseudomonadota bacterium]